MWTQKKWLLIVHASAISADPNKTASPASGLVGAGRFGYELLLSVLLKKAFKKKDWEEEQGGGQTDQRQGGWV